jgi:hypothetical protein
MHANDCLEKPIFPIFLFAKHFDAFEKQHFDTSKQNKIERSSSNASTQPTRVVAYCLVGLKIWIFGSLARVQNSISNDHLLLAHSSP